MLALFVTVGPLIGALVTAGSLALVIAAAEVVDGRAIDLAPDLIDVPGHILDGFTLAAAEWRLLLRLIVPVGGIPALIAGLMILVQGVVQGPPGWRFAALAGAAATTLATFTHSLYGSDRLQALYILSGTVAALTCWRLTRAIAPHGRTVLRGRRGGGLLEPHTKAARPPPPEGR